MTENNQCEWYDCDDAASTITSTETTADGIIRLCQKHFGELPI